MASTCVKRVLETPRKFRGVRCREATPPTCPTKILGRPTLRLRRQTSSVSINGVGRADAEGDRMMLEMLKWDARKELQVAKDYAKRGMKEAAKLHADKAHELHLEIAKLEEALAG